MTARHAQPTHETLVFDPSDNGPDRLEAEEIADVLRHMPLAGEELGDGGPADWTLSILLALAGWGDQDVMDYIAPRLEAAAKMVLADIGCPGPAFQGLVTD